MAVYHKKWLRKLGSLSSIKNHVLSFQITIGVYKLIFGEVFFKPFSFWPIFWVAYIFKLEQM